MSEIPKAYEPQAVEARWYQYWLDHRCFTADPGRASAKRAPYSVVIPPPNVTGMLHMGHVLNNTIQDILGRKARMDGKEVLWLPGTDHAGIATEGMVARQLWKEEKKRKQDVGREGFLKRVWDWKQKHGDIIIEQLKKLGCSCDWTRLRFTMDEPYVRCVQRVFVDLYKKGLIYRGKRMVNWCPATLTALSDEEVEMEPQKGFLWYFKVEVAGEPGTVLTIATTRPETIPGDTAVAVNPRDPRYARLIGKHALRPLPAELAPEKKRIPIIADDHIDPKFGTGVLKVTPAHDKADFEIGQRHNLPVVDIMNPDATMNELAGSDLRGLDRFEARKVAVEKLKALGALVKEEPYENNIGFSQRARVPIEPRLSEQWFLKYPSVEKALACVDQDRSAEIQLCPGGAEEPRGAGAPRSDRMRFHPQRWAKVYDHWMGNIQDWCISRQLWWGHRIPVWRRKPFPKDESWELFGLHFTASTDRFESVEHNGEKAYFRRVEVGDDIYWEAVTNSDYFARKLEESSFTQDPDVLDTWFSSWLWPFATMGWTGDPAQDAQNATLKTFYPTTDLVTAPDIIFFWVARMIMAGYEYMGDLPFRNVYFTGIIRDKQGRKMSKTLGNSPDPLELIARYGADALRFGTMRSAPLGQDILFDEKDVELGRNFCNKLWNACRFRQMVGQASNLSSDAAARQRPVTDPTNAGESAGVHSFFPGGEGGPCEIEGEINPALLTSDDKWILLRLDQAIREIDAAFAEYRFSEVTTTLHRFFWSEYCDWYVEASKATLARPVEALNRGSVEAGSASPAERSGEREGGGEGVPSTLERSNHSTNDARYANKLAVIDFVLSHTLRLFHPFLPFITEELWHGLGYNADLPAGQGGDTILFAHWPKPLDADFKAHYGLGESDERFVNAKYELVTRGRNLRREANMASNKKARFVLKVKDPLPTHEAEVIRLLLNAEPLDVDPNFIAAKGTPSVLTDLGELFLPREAVDRQAEKLRLQKEVSKIDGEIEKVRVKLNNSDFVQKVPAHVLQEHRKRLAEWETKRRQIRTNLEGLEE